MEELYALIEEKIRNSGYPNPVDGREFYEDVSDEADSQDNGSYLFVIKKDDDIVYHGAMDIFDHQFDLHYVDITSGDQTWHVDFDA